MTLSRDEILARLQGEYCSGRTPPGGWNTPSWPEDFDIDVEIASEFIEELLIEERDRCVAVINDVLSVFVESWDHGYPQKFGTVKECQAVIAQLMGIRKDILNG